ncbi:MAG: ATP-binding protein, partial [Acidobacteriota bacterium]
RRVRRFIDRNFYVNRYDYRTQWSYVTQALNDARHRDEVVRRAALILEEVFLTDAITVSLKEPATREIRPVLGKGSDNGAAVLPEDTPLYNAFLSEKRSLILDHKPDDFEYIPIYAENRGWLAATASEIVAPLIDGQEVVGVIGLERKHKDDPFTHEDATLLDSISTHIASAYRSARLGEEVAESREMEVLANWSNMIVHDVKNQLAPMRMIAENLETYPDRPGIGSIAARDLNRVAGKMETLVRTLSDLRGKPQLAEDVLDLDGLVGETVADMHLDRHEKLDIVMDLAAGESVRGDDGMLRRVVENLVTNAVEAMSGAGRLTVRTQGEGDPEERGRYVVLSITDTGCGISEEFLRNGLFRPFATTKRQGMGLGLYQCRSIIRGHGGEIRFESQPGKGTTAKVILKGIPGVKAEREKMIGVPVESEAFS